MNTLFQYSKRHAFIVLLKWLVCVLSMGMAAGIIETIVRAIVELAQTGSVAKDILSSSIIGKNPWGIIGINGIAWLLFLLWELHAVRLPWREALTMRARPLIRFAPVVLITVGGAVLVSNIETLFTIWAPMPQYLKDLMSDVGDFSACPLGSILALMVIAPLTEEVVCRGLILRGMLQKGVSPLVAVMWSALLFGIMHLNPWQAVGTFFLGLFWGWIYLRTRSLALTLTAHAANNGLALLAMNAPWLANLIPDDAPGFAPWWLNAAAGVLFVAGALWLWILTRAANEHAKIR